MKNSLFALTCILLLSCGSKSGGNKNDTGTDSTTQTITEDKSYLKKRPEEFQEFFKLTNAIPFTGKVAERSDLVSGKAVFVMNTKNDQQHTTCNIRLPFYAFKNTGTNPHELVVIMQAEILMRDTLLGFRQANGLYGMCRPGELEYFEADKDRVFMPVTPLAQ